MNLHKIGPLFVLPYFSIVRTVLACPRNSFGPTESSSHDDRFREELRSLFLQANRDIFAWQYTACLSLPKELIKPT
jgi:hypothetical protein